MNMRAALVCLALCLPAGTAQAVTVLAYSIFKSQGQTQIVAETEAPGVTPLDLMPGLGIAKTKISGKNLTLEGFSTDSAQDAAATGQFLSFGFVSETLVSLDSITLFLDRTGNGPKRAVLDVTLDNALTQVIGAEFDPKNAKNGLTFDLSALGSARSVTFRLLAWDAKKANGDLKFRIDPKNPFDLSGEPAPPAPVPLPPGIWMMLAGIAAFRVLRSRRAHLTVSPRAAHV